MQLLSCFPWCHLNSALPPLFSIHLSACVPKHFCLMISSLWFSQFRPLIDPLFLNQHYMRNVDCPVVLCIMVWGTGSPVVSLLSSCVNSHFNPLSQREGHHMAGTHGKDMRWFDFDSHCQRDLSLTVNVSVSVCRCVSCLRVYCLRFPQRLPEQNGQIPGIFFFFLAQGKVRPPFIDTKH